jgi:hypothetical protein
MSTRALAFADELTKLGGILSSILGRTVKTVAKNPMRTLGVGMIAVPTAIAMKRGYEGGVSPGESRQLAAGRDETGRIRPSQAAYTNYHELLPHKARAHEIRALSKNYKPGIFEGYGDKSKEK